MSDPSADNRSYSVDEILDKLREGERSKTAREEGELVTRSDGSQALRIKKRKRRTKQEKEEKAKRKKVFNRIKILFAIALPLALALCALLLMARYHSGAFSRKLEATIQKMGGGKAHFSRLNPMPTKVTALAMTSQWPDGGYLDQMQLAGVSADLKWYSYFTGSWRGEAVNAQSGMILLSQRQGRNSSILNEKTLVEPQFNTFSCQSLTAFFGQKKSNFRIANASAILQTKENGTDLLLEGGECVFPGWGQYPLRRATLKLSEDRVEIVSFRLGGENEGEILISGTLLQEEGEKELNVKFDDAPFRSLLGAELGELISGRFAGDEGILTFQTWDYDSHQIYLDAKPLAVTLAKFQFLQKIHDLYPKGAASEPELSSYCRFKVLRRGQRVEISEIDLRELGGLGMRGSITVDGAKISGDLEVGMPAHQRPLIPSANIVRFERASKTFDGFSWVPVKLSGTVAEPLDDFASYFDEGPVPKVPASTAPDEKESLFDELTR